MRVNNTIVRYNILTNQYQDRVQDQKKIKFVLYR